MRDLEPDSIARLIEPGRVHRRVYTDPELFDLEMERIFARAWIYVGHESQVGEPGSYYATSIGRQPVIMVRHRDGRVHVLHNRCAHKGAQLVGDRAGKLKVLRCAYHGWVYDTDGSIKTIPQEAGYAGSGFGREHPCASLKPVARVDSYRGFVFASLSPEGPDLTSWLGATRAMFDNAVDRAPEGEIELTGGCLRYVHDANWKMLLENITDNMHPMVTHASAVQPARRMLAEFDADALKPFALSALQPFGEPYDFFDEIGMTVCGNGHSYSGGSLSIHSAYPEDPEYLAALEAVHGPERTREILAVKRHNIVIYPSLSFKCALQTIRVYRPLAVDRTIQETWTFRLKGAPEAMLQRAILYNRLVFSPTSIAGHDDYEVYHRMQRGLQSAGGDWISMHRHAGRDQANADGTLSAPGSSEIVVRHEFDTWRRYMCAEQIPPA